MYIIDLNKTSTNISSSLCSWPTWADQASGGGEDTEPAEDSQSGCGGKDSPWDPEPQTLPSPTYNQAVSNAMPWC